MSKVVAPEKGADLDPQAAQQLVFQLGTGYILSTALYVAASLRVADQLAEGPRRVSDLAGAAGANEDALYRVLRTLRVSDCSSKMLLVSLRTTPRLRCCAPARQACSISWSGSRIRSISRVYADAMHSVMTGQPAIEKTVGVPAFDYFPKDPELSERFNNAMTAFSASVIPAAMEVYDFSGIGTLVDVAGGHGQILIVDSPEVPADARRARRSGPRARRR